jgi:hypothetical protein
LSQLESDGLVRIGARGVSLTSGGLKRHAELLTERRESSDTDTIAAAYERFLALNGPVKSACARWQQSGRDEEALFEVADELAGYIARALPSLQKSAEMAPWFTHYGRRLSAASECLLEGDPRFVTDPQVDCVHNIWFECHEDYLLTLGRSREEEEAR